MSPLYVNSEFSIIDLKQKKNRMEPINCTGVSAAFGMTWKCKPCGFIQHQRKEDCNYYKNYHQPFHHIENNVLNHPNELPTELEQRDDGIYTKGQGIKPFTRLGPLKGQVSNNSSNNINIFFTEKARIFCPFWFPADTVSFNPHFK